MRAGAAFPVLMWWVLPLQDANYLIQHGYLEKVADIEVRPPHAPLMHAIVPAACHPAVIFVNPAGFSVLRKMGALRSALGEPLD